jgi:hypothetical protein
LYESKDDSFTECDDLRERILSAFKVFRELEPIHNTALTKPHMTYSLIQAIAHTNKPVPKFETQFASPRVKRLDLNSVLPRLTRLAQAVENGDEEGRLARFVRASSEKTNVRVNRAIRFRSMCRALVG